MYRNVGLNIFTFFKGTTPSCLKIAHTFFSFASPFNKSVRFLKVCKPFFFFSCF